jgi:hypothetical protein
LTSSSSPRPSSASPGHAPGPRPPRRRRTGTEAPAKVKSLLPCAFLPPNESFLSLFETVLRAFNVRGGCVSFNNSALNKHSMQRKLKEKLVYILPYIYVYTYTHKCIQLMGENGGPICMYVYVHICMYM